MGTRRERKFMAAVREGRVEGEVEGEERRDSQMSLALNFWMTVSDCHSGIRTDQARENISRR